MNIKEKVYEYLRTIPSGKVVTYGQIAAHLGNPGLARAVGNALHVNPDPDRNPCFRVVNASGKLSDNFGCGGMDEQKRRLEEDGIEVIGNRVDLARYQWIENKQSLILEFLPAVFAVCRLSRIEPADLTAEYTFFAKTDCELSLVCPTENVPDYADDIEDGWRAFRITGVLDFSLIGILSGISSVLAEAGIGIFALSTYNTDYILVKEANMLRAAEVLSGCGYSIIGLNGSEVQR